MADDNWIMWTLATLNTLAEHPEKSALISQTGWATMRDAVKRVFDARVRLDG